jgi:hypothetical protein
MATHNGTRNRVLPTEHQMPSKGVRSRSSDIPLPVPCSVRLANVPFKDHVAHRAHIYIYTYITTSLPVNPLCVNPVWRGPFLRSLREVFLGHQFFLRAERAKR